MWPLSPIILRSLTEPGSFVLRLFPTSQYFISTKSFQRCFKSKKSTNYSLYVARPSKDDERIFDITLSEPASTTQSKSSSRFKDKPENSNKSLSTNFKFRERIPNHNGSKNFNNGFNSSIDGSDGIDNPWIDKFNDKNHQIDEKFRLYLEGKTPSQMVDTLKTHQHLVDLVRFRTFIRQMTSSGVIYEYYLTPEQFEFIYMMLMTFPEMTSDISNLIDLAGFVHILRISSTIPLVQYIAREMIKKIDEMSFDDVFGCYKSLQALKTSIAVEGLDSLDHFDLLNDDVLRARYLLISNIAFRIETLHFDETDISTLCEVFRRVNKELYAKEAIDILVKSIVSMSAYMKSKNSTDIIAGFCTINGAKILKTVSSSGDEAIFKQYRELIDLAMVVTGRLTNSNVKQNIESTKYVSDVLFHNLIKGNKFNSPSFWQNFLSEIDFSRHKMDLHSWQNLLTLVNRFRLYYPPIIDALAPLVIRNAQMYINDRQISPIPYIRIMTECYHKPMTVNWDKFLDLLLHPKKIAEVPIERTLSLLSRLAILGDYSKIRDFDLDTMKSSLLSYKNQAQNKRLLTLYSGLVHESDNYNHKWLIKREFASLTQRAINQLDKDIRIGSISPLQSILENLFGGPEFVIHGVWTKTGVFMHHLLVLRRGEYPVAIRNKPLDSSPDPKITYFHEIPVPSEAKTVTVIPTYKYYYSNHSRTLRGKIEFKLRIYRKLGILPIMIDISEFETLPPHERTHWLFTKIRQKVTEGNSEAWEFWR